MHRTFSAVLGAVVLALAALTHTTPAEDNVIYTDTIWSSVRLATNATATSTPIWLGQRKPTGFFSIQLWSTNTVGTVSVYYQLSNDGLTFYPEQGIPNPIITNAPAGGTFSGDFYPAVATHMRFIAVATNDGATITATCANQ